jgi:hypothetical protein
MVLPLLLLNPVAVPLIKAAVHEYVTVPVVVVDKAIFVALPLQIT